MPLKGVPAFDGLAVLNIDAIDFTTVDVRLVGHAAFVNLSTGDTFGETTIMSRWSKETLNLLAMLRESMERDIGEFVFLKDSATPARGAQTESLANRVPVGIGEHAEPDAEASSI